MIFSRRGFIVAGQALLASAALPLRVLGAAGSTFSKVANLNLLTRANFLPLINSSFSVTSSSLPTAWFTLLSVEDMNPKAPSKTPTMAVMPKKLKSPVPQTETYALHFYATGDQLPQGTYEFQHPLLGKFPLFIVPSGTNTYAAVVSHLVVPAQLSVPVKAAPKVGVPARSASPLPTL